MLERLKGRVQQVSSLQKDGMNVFIEIPNIKWESKALPTPEEHDMITKRANKVFRKIRSKN